MEGLQVSEYFVYPQIGWAEKSAAVKRLAVRTVCPAFYIRDRDSKQASDTANGFTETNGSHHFAAPFFKAAFLLITSDLRKQFSQILLFWRCLHLTVPQVLAPVLYLLAISPSKELNDMFLSKECLVEFEENGFTFIPDYFSEAEVSVLKQQLPAVFSDTSFRLVREKEGQAVRSVYGSHQVNEVFRRLAQHPRIVEPAMQVLSNKVYVYQFKINGKSAFSGDLWDWHQDYVFWLMEDGMPKPRVVNVAIFLDEVHEFNGPIFVMQGSHKEGVIAVEARQKAIGEAGPGGAYQNSPAWISNLTSNLKYSLDKSSVSKLAQKYNLVSIKGRAGSALFFDANLVHSSPNNISPFDRAIIFITFNSIDNVPLGGASDRPDFIVNRDSTPVTPLSDDTLFF